MKDDELIRQWLARNEPRKLPEVPRPKRKVGGRRAKWKASKSFRSGGKFS